MTGAGLIVVIGSYNSDVSLSVRRFPVPGETITAARTITSHGGKGSNQATQAARFGAAVVFIAAVGEDEAGRRALEFWQLEKIETNSVFIERTRPTGRATILVDEGGQNMIVVGSGANDALSPDAVIDQLDGMESRPALLLAQLETPQDATIAAFRWARGRRIMTILNAAPISGSVDPDLLDLTDLLIVNEIEAITLTRSSLGSSDALAAAEQLTRTCRLGVILTCGSSGAVLFRNGGAIVHKSAPVVDVKDTTGAGDALIGAFAAELAAVDDMDRALEWGVAAGSLACGGYGAVSSYGTKSDVAAIVRALDVRTIT